eukprot:1792530-Rhodomonas_salina.5
MVHVASMTISELCSAVRVPLLLHAERRPFHGVSSRILYSTPRPTFIGHAKYRKLIAMVQDQRMALDLSHKASRKQHIPELGRDRPLRPCFRQSRHAVHALRAQVSVDARVWIRMLFRNRKRILPLVDVDRNGSLSPVNFSPSRLVGSRPVFRFHPPYFPPSSLPGHPLLPPICAPPLIFSLAVFAPGHTWKFSRASPYHLPFRTGVK